MMKRESGQGLVEYALILVLVGIVVVVCLAMVLPKLINPPQPPAMDAPLLDIVRWCETNARDTYSETTTAYNPTTKTIETKPVTKTKDSPEKFIVCMQGYEYMVKR